MRRNPPSAQRGISPVGYAAHHDRAARSLIDQRR